MSSRDITKPVSPTQAFKILLKQFPEIEHSKSILIYFITDMTTTHTFKQTKIYTIIPLKISYVKDKKYYNIVKGINKNLFPAGISWSITPKSYDNKQLKTSCKVNILQILTREDVLTKKNRNSSSTIDTK